VATRVVVSWAAISVSTFNNISSASAQTQHNQFVCVVSVDGKYSLNAYQDLKVVGPDHNGASNSASVTEHNWGYSSASGCGQFVVERPGQDQSLDEDADGCGASTAAPVGTTRNCDAGVRSQHGWHSNIIRVKKTAGGDVHGGPFFVKVTVFNHGRGIYNVKVSDSKAC
jgi:hypothetical protein